MITLENEWVRYVIGPDGQNRHFIDRQSGKDRLQQGPPSPAARIKQKGEEFTASSASMRNGRIVLGFGKSGVEVALKGEIHPHYLTLEVLSVRGEDVQEVAFTEIPLSLKGEAGEPFAGCALALNLKTNVEELPRANSRLRALCYPRFGFRGAKAALIGCPTGKLRAAMQEAVSAAEDLPHSPIGGPWALGQAINQGSYLFNFGNMTKANVKEWIDLARSLGINQIDFHGGGSFRFGDCLPNPETYPNGRADFKAVIDQLHAAGIKAGLHTYAFFIDKRCPWVTPVPDPRLAKDAAFTLAEPLSAESAAVLVRESTQEMSAITGFFVRNSVTLQIEDELITYTGVSKEPPYAFTNCQRGAYGTKAVAHAPGAKVHHLKECFGLFLPDGDSTLLSEVAARNAEMFNECGFDMMYLDALDGEDTLGGAENGWHYGSKFVFALWKRLQKPALMEMSTFHHHLWYVRSRLGAWDHPNRGHKPFIDLHCRANEEFGKMFLPGHLGWWAVKPFTGVQEEPTFADDIEYLCAKALGNDYGFSMMGVDPDGFARSLGLQRLGGIMQRYESLRHARYFPEPIKARLRRPGEDFTLSQNAKGRWELTPVQYAKHKVTGPESASWTTANRFGPQPLRLRIEALMSVGPYDAPGNTILADFADPAAFDDRVFAPGITGSLTASADQAKVSPVSGYLFAASARSDAGGKAGSWAKVGKHFEPPLDLSGQQALGVWVCGDGQGEVLNVQFRSPEHLSGGVGDHYIPVDFTGWRYFELVEFEGERADDYLWPYSPNYYATYREGVLFHQISSLSLWLNDIPPGKTAACYLGPVKALPLVSAKMKNPRLTVGGRTILFPVEIESGSFLEMGSLTDCKLYGPQGDLLREVAPQGDLPALAPGENAVTFACEGPEGVTVRAKVTVITRGDPLR
ncbi:MAG: hypothetical protein IT210_18440 [Armatimonadetes bacterium]|nr:hypothetical protein [Armatimonadota bacterium]